jgi:hypothetical protein
MAHAHRVVELAGPGRVTCEAAILPRSGPCGRPGIDTVTYPGESWVTVVCGVHRRQWVRAGFIS